MLCKWGTIQTNAVGKHAASHRNLNVSNTQNDSLGGESSEKNIYGSIQVKLKQQTKIKVMLKRLQLGLHDI